MSISMNSSLKLRLIEHIGYQQTCKPNETANIPNLNGANNFYLGTEEELKSYVKFEHCDMQQCFNKWNQALRLPNFIDREVHLVACDTTSSDTTSKVNVYGVYTIKGMVECISKCKDHSKFKWKSIHFDKQLFDDLFNDVQPKVKMRTIVPTVPAHTRWCSVS
jgi:hypothetical protein